MTNILTGLFVLKGIKLFSLFLIFVNLTLGAQNSKEVKLIVNGDASTKDAAIAQALRSAVEMSFGTFVSANTTILDDEVLKDEVATISSGNIKSFTEVASVRTEDGYNVTLEAVVSLEKLISYAKSKGSSCEFAGQTFAMNMKMRELNKQNELKVINHLKDQVSLIAKDVFDVTIQAQDPKYDKNGTDFVIPLKISFTSNAAANTYYDIVTKTLCKLSLTQEEIEEYKRSNNKMYELVIKDAGIVSRLRWSVPSYSYHYVFRNEQTKSTLLDLLLMPYQSVKLEAKYSSGSSYLGFLGKNEFSRSGDFYCPYYCPYFSSERVSGESTTITFPYFTLLKGVINNNGKQAITDIRVIDGDRRSFVVSDMAAPRTIFYCEEATSRVNKENETANSILMQAFMGDNYEKAAGRIPLFSITYYCFITCEELNQLTGFSISREHLHEIEVEAVDLGLSVKWGRTNLGASRIHPDGDFSAWGFNDYKFAWGELEPKKISPSDYNSIWSTYKFAADKEGRVFTKYNGEDKKTLLDFKDDVAHVKLGGNWRMPTVEEWKELHNKCVIQPFDIRYNQSTRRYYRVTGPNGNSIIIPAGSYWTSSIASERSNVYGYKNAYDALFRGDMNYMEIIIDQRFTPYLIRPVTE